MKDTMLDLETLGTGSNAVIVSIGAVNFDENDIQPDGFYAVLEREDQKQHGREISAGTADWWLQQSEGARQVFRLPRRPVVEVLEEFEEFVRDRVWGNGADFDNIILGSLYEAYGMKKPWSYSQNRCFRTLKNMMSVKGLPGRQGTHHNALHDAIYQTQCLQVYLKGKVKLG